MPRLDFWYDFGSTYSYPAVMRIEEEAAKRGVSVTWRPLLLGPIFQKFGLDTSPFRANPVKGAYMWRDLERLCLKHGLPFRQPPEFPQNGLLAARIALILSDAERPAFTRAVFLYEFGEGGVISEDDAIKAVMEKLGYPVEETVARAQMPENKLKLRQATEHAAALHIFGAPTFFTEDGEMFWGHDRMEDALDWAVRL
ncbi:2-hydroxychromene-2-carboxylate isomerase [Terrihabitans soli]|uniref:2-hydroxychromene-2-carboxylate isomerase n=1 Tax=Terrihabitans soli TaxID=708113 RepID=A0A6S6QTH9_9HYPH|nr:2-hydroxychromene-2-carboxylate isomerase [Terrihabitans soli]BCJ92399.1 2-hydroxychromene-2-carboxylate isomerase [Terrihabitans soli]